MGIDVGANIEVVLRNDNPSVEKDSLTGPFRDWARLATGSAVIYLAMGLEGSKVSYIPESAIRVIHVL